MLAGLIAPSSGTVRFQRPSRRPAPRRRCAPAIGFLTEAPGLWDRLTVRQNLRVYARLHGLPRPDRRGGRGDGALRHDATAPASRPRCCRRDCGSASRWRGRCCTIRAVVLLDEPTSGLDPESARDVRELVLRLRARAAGGADLDAQPRRGGAAGRPRRRCCNTHLVAVDTPQALRARAVRRARPRRGSPAPRTPTRTPAAGAGADRRARGRRRAVDRSSRRRRRAARRTSSDGSSRPAPTSRRSSREKPSLEQVYLRLLKGGPP